MERALTNANGLDSLLNEIEGRITSNNIVETDIAKDLISYHFEECNIDSDNVTKSFRGIVKKGNTVVCKTFNFTPEIDINEIELFKDLIQPMLSSKCKAFISYESSLLRIFYEDDWYITTCRKLDAFKSKWGTSKSFGDILYDCLKKKQLIDPLNEEEYNTIKEEINNKPIFENEKQRLNNDTKRKEIKKWCEKHLQKNKCYCFILRTYDDNRIVCKGYTDPEMFYVGEFNRESNFTYEFNPDYFYNESVLGTKIKEYNLETIEDCILTVKSIFLNTAQGIMLIDNQGNSIKLLNNRYLELLKLRGNQPHILLRYIELQQQGDPEQVKKLTELYQDQYNVFLEFQDVVDDITANIYRKYRNRFVRKTVSIAPPDQYYVIRELHTFYLQDKTNNIITPEKVSSYVYSLDPTRLFGLYRMYMKRKALNGHGNKLQDDYREKLKDTILI
jgi:hypothetical protein